jgi:hypothetical protein
MVSARQEDSGAIEDNGLFPGRLGGSCDMKGQRRFSCAALLT